MQQKKRKQRQPGSQSRQRPQRPAGGQTRSQSRDIDRESELDEE